MYRAFGICCMLHVSLCKLRSTMRVDLDLKLPMKSEDEESSMIKSKICIYCTACQPQLPTYFQHIFPKMTHQCSCYCRQNFMHVIRWRRPHASGPVDFCFDEKQAEVRNLPVVLPEIKKMICFVSMQRYNDWIVQPLSCSFPILVLGDVR